MSYSSHDEGHGLIKTYWAKVRSRVKHVDPVFTKLIDAISPNKNHPLFLAYYKYGQHKGDTKSAFIPDMSSNYYRLSSPSAPTAVTKHLGYAANSAPFGLVLDKSFEFYVEMKEQNITIPIAFYPKGTFFPFSKLQSYKQEKSFTPNGIVKAIAGARSTFLLPSVSCHVHHNNLQHHYGLKDQPPQNLYDQWGIFNKIINSNHDKPPHDAWHACMLYFSESWINKIIKDPAWREVKDYLLTLAWEKSEYHRNYFYYDIAFSLIQRQKNLKPNPYLLDTVRHLFLIGLGIAPAYVPATKNDALPLDEIVSAYKDIYNLSVAPIIMHPRQINLLDQAATLYYSLQYPSTYMFSPRSEKSSSKISELRQIEHIARICQSELAKKSSICSDSVISTLAKQTSFNYFHNSNDKLGIVNKTEMIPNIDKSMSCLLNGTPFPKDAHFLRGCITIQSKV